MPISNFTRLGNIGIGFADQEQRRLTEQQVQFENQRKLDTDATTAVQQGTEAINAIIEKAKEAGATGQQIEKLTESMVMGTAGILEKMGQDPSRLVESVRAKIYAPTPTPVTNMEADFEAKKALFEKLMAPPIGLSREQALIQAGLAPKPDTTAARLAQQDKKAADKAKAASQEELNRSFSFAAESDRKFNSLADAFLSEIKPKLGGGFQTAASTGVVAQITGGIRALPAGQLETALNQFKAVIGFDRLQKMRDDSSTGGALGQVAVKELVFLQSVEGQLEASMEPEQLSRNIIKVMTSFAILREHFRLASSDPNWRERYRIPETGGLDSKKYAADLRAAADAAVKQAFAPQVKENAGVTTRIPAGVNVLPPGVTVEDITDTTSPGAVPAQRTPGATGSFPSPGATGGF